MLNSDKCVWCVPISVPKKVPTWEDIIFYCHPIRERRRKVDTDYFGSATRGKELKKGNDVMKKVFVVMLAFVMVVTGICFLKPNATEVQAEGSRQGDYITITKAECDALQKENGVPVMKGYLFAGYFKSEDCIVANKASEKDATYAKFVAEDVLDLKFQITKNDGKGSGYNIRLISSVDGLAYKNVGFEVSYDNGEEIVTLNKEMNAIYESIESKSGLTVDDSYTESFSPKLIGENSEYFITAKLPVEENDETEYNVQAYWTTLDGTTVYGNTRTVSLDDLADDVVNLTVDGVLIDGVTATYGPNATGTGSSAASVTILSTENGKTNVRVQLADGTKASDLKSATKFVFSDGSSAIYRNYNTTHKKATTPSDSSTNRNAANADTSWYDVNPDATVFYIATSADLYGLANIVNAGTHTFAGDTVIMVKDITVNKGYVQTYANTGAAPAWVAASGEPVYRWKPIGADRTAAKSFAGCFDGDGNEISGIVVTASGSYNEGLFGGAGAGSEFKNFRLVNSFIRTTGVYIGMIAWGAPSLIENVYTDMTWYLERTASSNDMQAGAFAGYITGYGTDKTTTLNNCWFDGEIYRTNGSCIATFVGGVGASSSTLNFTNCLSTGTVKNIAGNKFAPFLSHHSWSNLTVNIKNCVVLGDYEAGSVTNVGSLVSTMNGTVNADHVYVSNALPETKSISGTVTTNVFERVSRSGLLGLTQAEVNTKLPALAGETESAWVADSVSNSINRGTPILKVFADWWTGGKLVADTSWYNESATEFILMDAEDLNGLALIVNSGLDNFADKTVKLGGNITVNEVSASILNQWEIGQNVPQVGFEPIGTAARPFAGTFDGQGYTLSGIYVSSSAPHVGLFGITAAGSLVKDVKIVDSYFEQPEVSSAKYIGSVVGELRGDMSQVYSSAIVVSNGSNVGGLIGRTNASGEVMTLSECWFAGRVTTGTKSQIIGGIAGRHADGTLEFNDVLFTGIIDADYNDSGNACIGGLIGITANDTTMKLYLNSAVAAGRIIGNHNHKVVSATVGYLENVTGGFANYLFGNVFATRECYSIPYKKSSSISLYNYKVDESSNTSYIMKGDVIQTSATDRLLGYIPQRMNGVESASGGGVTADANAQLDFTTKWTLRKTGIPVLKYFESLGSDVILGGVSASALATEIGLDYWDADALITDAKGYGAGNYVATYYVTDYSQYSAYLSKLTNELGFQLYVDNSSSTMDNDGVYSCTYYKEATETAGEWVLNITYVDNPVSDKIGNRPGQTVVNIVSGKMVYISINTDTDSLASTLQSDNALATQQSTVQRPVTLTMLEDESGLASGGSNSFVFQLPNGHFIINDGGYYKYNGNGGAATIINYLRSLTNGGPVYIDAWTISHFHDDHIGALTDFTNDASLRENVYLDAIYVCEPSTAGLKSWNHYNAYDWAGKVYQGLMMLQKSETDSSRPDIHQLHMGQRYYFNGITMDVIDTQEQHPIEYWSTGTYNSYISLPDPSNTPSTNLLFTVEAGENAYKKVLLGGDATLVNMKFMTEAYGETTETLSGISVFSAYHHGKNVMFDLDTSLPNGTLGNRKWGYTTWADYLLQGGHQFDVVLFTDSKIFDVWYNATEDKWYSDGTVSGAPAVGSTYPRNISAMNRYYTDNAEEYYTFGYEDTYAAATGKRHGSVVITFGADGVSTSVLPSIYGETIPDVAVQIWSNMIDPNLGYYTTQN